MLPRCLAAVPRPPSTRSSIVDTGSTRPHGRDRRVVRRDASSHHEWTGDFADARNVSFDAATGDWIARTSTPTRSSSREDVERLRDAARPDLARGLLPRRDQLHGRPRRRHRRRPTTRCASSATAPEYRFEGRLHEQIANTLPASPARAPRGDRRSASSTSATSAPSATRRRSRAATSSCSSSSAPRATRRPVPALQPRLRVRRRSATRVAALDEFEQRLASCIAAEADMPRSRLRAVARRPPRARAARCAAATRRRSNSPPTSLDALPRLHRPRLRAGAPPRPRSAGRDEAIALLERCLEMGDAPGRYSATIGMGTYPAADRAGRAAAASAASRRARPRCSRLPRRAPGFLGLVHAVRERAAGRRHGPRRRSSRAIEARVAS